MFKLIDVTKELPKHRQEVIVATNEKIPRYLHMWYDEHYNEFRDFDRSEFGVDLAFKQVKGWYPWSTVLLLIEDNIPFAPHRLK